MHLSKFSNYISSKNFSENLEEKGLSLLKNTCKNVGLQCCRLEIMRIEWLLMDSIKRREAVGANLLNLKSGKGHCEKGILHWPFMKMQS